MKQFDRRCVLLGMGAGAATASPGLRSPLWAQAAAHKIGVGSFEVNILSDGTLLLPTSVALPGRDTGEVDALFAQAGLPAGGIIAQVNVAVVKTPDALILIDTGGGGDFMPGVGKLADALEGAGFAADAFTHVIFTHAHADHLWGVIDPFDGGTRFPNARHIMSVAEFGYWTKPGREADVPDLFKPMALGTARRLTAITERIEQRKSGDEIVPGVQLVDTAGHTPGHISVRLQSGNEQLLVGGDALSHALVSFSNPGWRWGSDMDAGQAITTRLRLLDQLASEKMILLGYHLPWPGLGRVERRDKHFRFVPV